MSTQQFTPETLEKAIASSDRIIFSSPHGMSGRSISSTTVKPGIGLTTLAELGAIWGDYTLAAGDHLISVTWSDDPEGSEGKFIGNLQTGDQYFRFNLIMPEAGSQNQIEVSELKEVVSEVS